MSRSRARRKRVAYRNNARGEIEELAARVAEVQREQHATNARRSLVVGLGVCAICLVLVVWRVLFNVDAWLGPILAHGFGGG